MVFMPRCGRCGTTYSDGARYCPKCGQPEEPAKGLFAAPRPSFDKRRAEDGRARRGGGFFAVPLPFAVIAAGLLLNPAVRVWLLKAYFYAVQAVSPAYSPNPRAVWTLSYVPGFVSMFSVMLVLGASVLRDGSSRLLRAAAVLLLMLTAVTLAEEVSKFFQYMQTAHGGF